MAAQGRFRFLQRWSSLTAFFAAFRDEVPSLESRDRDLEDYLSKMDDRVVVTEGAIVATPVSVPNGGTAIDSYAVGDLLYASATTTLAKLADVATGNALISGGVATAPSWGKIALNTHTTGTLALGTDTTGDYVAGVSGSGLVTVTGSGGEGSTPAVTLVRRGGIWTSDSQSVSDATWTTLTFENEITDTHTLAAPTWTTLTIATAGWWSYNLMLGWDYSIDASGTHEAQVLFTDNSSGLKWAQSSEMNVYDDGTATGEYVSGISGGFYLDVNDTLAFMVQQITAGARTLTRAMVQLQLTGASS